MQLFLSTRYNLREKSEGEGFCHFDREGEKREIIEEESTVSYDLSPLTPQSPLAWFSSAVQGAAPITTKNGTLLYPPTTPADCPRPHGQR